MMNEFLVAKTNDGTEKYYILKSLIEDIRIETRNIGTADVFIDTKDKAYYMGCFTTFEQAEVYVERVLQNEV